MDGKTILKTIIDNISNTIKIDAWNSLSHLELIIHLASIMEAILALDRFSQRHDLDSSIIGVNAGMSRRFILLEHLKKMAQFEEKGDNSIDNRKN